MHGSPIKKLKEQELMLRKQTTNGRNSIIIMDPSRFKSMLTKKVGDINLRRSTKDFIHMNKEVKLLMEAKALVKEEKDWEGLKRIW